MASDDRRRRLAGLALASTAACSAPPPLAVEIVSDVELGPAVALDVALRGEGVRCKRIALPSAQPRPPYHVVIVDELTDGLTSVAVTARDASGAAIGAGTVALEAGGDEGGPVSLRLAASPRFAARRREYTAFADVEGRAGQQLAVTASGEVAAIWIDARDEFAVLARRIDAPWLDLPDRPMPTAYSAARAQPIVSAVPGGLLAGWIEEEQSLMIRLLAAPDPVPVTSQEGQFARAAAGTHLVDPAFVHDGQHTALLWVEATRGDQAGRIGLRWLDETAGPLGGSQWLGPVSAAQHGPVGASVGADEVAIGWLERAEGASSVRMARVSRDHERGAIVPVSVVGDRVRSLAMARAGGGRIAVAWSDDAGVRVAVFDRALVQQGDVQRIADGDIAQVELAPRSDGGLIAAWRHESDGARLRWLDPDGVPEESEIAAVPPGVEAIDLSLVGGIGLGGEGAMLGWDAMLPGGLAASQVREVSRNDRVSPAEECP